MSPASHPRGILTLATGSRRYIDMAIQLARSIRLNSPNQTLAVVSDHSGEDLKRWFDLVVPFNPAYGTGLVQKLHLYDYSPFSETLFIDADCFVVRDLSFLWTVFEGSNVSMIGTELRTGDWSGMDVQSTCSKLAIPYLIQFNGGVYYFRRNGIAEQVFRKAQELVACYDELGIAYLRGTINEEPLMSIAMAMHEQHPVNDRGLGMRTRIGQTGPFDLDVLRGRCRFVSKGVLVEPAIMHFGGQHTQGFFYRREKRKIDWHARGLSRRAASRWVNLTWNSYLKGRRFCSTLKKQAERLAAQAIQASLLS